MNDYERAVALVKMHPDKCFFAGNRSESLIQAAEDLLDLKFPPTYRRFLLEYGAGNFGAFEIYGVIDEHFFDSAVPDGVWYTLQERAEVALPANLFVISDTGEGDLVCLQIENNLEESPVIVFRPGLIATEQNLEVIASDFGKFLLQGVERQVSR